MINSQEINDQITQILATEPDYNTLVDKVNDIFEKNGICVDALYMLALDALKNYCKDNNVAIMTASQNIKPRFLMFFGSIQRDFVCYKLDLVDRKYYNYISYGCVDMLEYPKLMKEINDYAKDEPVDTVVKKHWLGRMPAEDREELHKRVVQSSYRFYQHPEYVRDKELLIKWAEEVAQEMSKPKPQPVKVIGEGDV